MGVNDTLGLKGIFISDDAREHLNLTLDVEVFEKMKEQIKEGSEDMYKCFVTGQWCPKDKGIFLPPDMMANAMEENIKKTDELWDLYKKDGIVITSSGERVSGSSLSSSELKKYEKKVKLGWTKKIAIRGYISLLRKKK